MHSSSTSSFPAKLHPHGGKLLPSRLHPLKTSIRATHNPSPPAAAAGALVLSAAAALLSARLSRPALACPPPPPPAVCETLVSPEASGKALPFALSRLLDSSPDAADALRSFVHRKLELCEDEDALALLQQLVAARPDEPEWRFLLGRLLNEMGRPMDARKVFDEILQRDPLCFDALFENTVLMDRCGEGAQAMERLQVALASAREEGRDREARDVRMIMAQLLYLRRQPEEALRSYEELALEDPNDYRPYFCQGVIYTLMGKDKEAQERFSQYKAVSPREFDVDGYLQTPLSRVKLFGTRDNAIVENEAVQNRKDAIVGNEAVRDRDNAIVGNEAVRNLDDATMANEEVRNPDDAVTGNEAVQDHDNSNADN